MARAPGAVAARRDAAYHSRAMTNGAATSTAPTTASAMTMACPADEPTGKGRGSRL